MNMLKKPCKTLSILCALLAASLSLTACGPSSGSASAPSGAAPQSSAPAASGASSSAPALEEITFLTKDYYSSPEYGQKLEEIFQKTTGVKLSIRHVPTNNWEEKITASFVSGDMPDIARIDSDAYPFVKQEFIIPLGDYIEDNAALKELFAKNPSVVESYQYFEDIYAVSISNQKSMTLWARGDWMEKLGIAQPKTLDEFTDMLRKFRDSDLDGNGKQDTIPLTLSSTLKNYDCIAAAFGTRGEVFMKDGKAVNPYPTSEYKEYMDYMKMLYAEGLIDREMPTSTSYGSVRTKFNTGLAASVIMWDDIYDSLRNGLNQSNLNDADVVPLTAFQTEKGMFGYAYYEADSPIAITSACKQPKEVFDTFFTWYFTDPAAIVSTCQGIEGYSFDVKDGQLVPNADNGGVGFHGQSLPPVMRDFKFPFKLADINQKEYDYILEMNTVVDANLEKIVTKAPAPSFTEFQNVRGDLLAKMQDLFFNYVMGKLDYEKYLAEYTAYAAEIGLDAMVAQITD